MISFIDWLKKVKTASREVINENITVTDEYLLNLINQIEWIQNLTDTTKAQEIFEIWYKEMVEETPYDIIKIGE